MLDRFIGEAVITFSDKSRQTRRVLILSPYVQTSENLRDIDYDHSLVADLQTMEFDFKSQIEEMLQNRELQSYHTFMEYANKTVFRNGENVLQWLHRMKQISRVPATDVLVTVGQGGHQQKIKVVDINREIRANNEKKLAQQNEISSTYTDSSMNESNIQPATIERSGNQHRTEAPQQVNEAVSPEVQVDEPTDSQPAMPSDAVDLSSVPGVTILEGGDFKPDANQSSTETVDFGPAPTENQKGSEVTELPSVNAEPATNNNASVSTHHLEERIDALEKLVKSRTKDTVVTRLMNRYELTEADAVKAIESAGKRKQKKAEKETQKKQESKTE